MRAEWMNLLVSIWLEYFDRMLTDFDSSFYELAWLTLSGRDFAIVTVFGA